METLYEGLLNDGEYWLDPPQPISARILARVIMTIRHFWIRNSKYFQGKIIISPIVTIESVKPAQSL